MVKKTTSQPGPDRRSSTRTIKKKQRPDEEQFYQQEESNQQLSPHDDRDSNQSNQSLQKDEQDGMEDQDDDEQDDQDDDEDQQSTPKIAPENMAIRNMQFRERRGTKMNYLINRKKQEEEDPFWADMGQNYFGNLEEGDNDEEDYVESSSGRDEFDSDFDQTESEHDDEAGPNEEKEVDQDKQKEKRKRQQLMRKIQAPAPTKKVAFKTSTPSTKKPESQKKLPPPESTSRYIHQLFNQQQLLGEAATTQYFNWLSLKKLILYETQKKDFTKRSHHIEGPKIIYRNKINDMGVNEETYQLDNVVVKKVEDLTEILHQN